MAQGIEASIEATAAGATPRRRSRRASPGTGCGSASAGYARGRRLPPPSADGVAAARGRDARAVRRPRLAPGVVEHVTRERGGAPLHFLLAWGVAHLGFGLGGLRIVSAAFALASLPLVAALGRRLGGPRVGLVAAVLVAPSWLFLFHGVYGRMYSLFLFLSLACTLALLRALERGGRGRWAVWVAASLTMVAAHPYGILLLAGRRSTSCSPRATGSGRRSSRASRCSCSASRSGSPTSCSRAGSTSASAAVARSSGPGRVARYLWRSVGDATAGWWPVTLAVVVAAAVGVVFLRRTGSHLVLCLVGTTVAAFLVAKLGGSAAPESRHLIFLAPAPRDRGRGNGRPARAAVR